MFRRSGTTGTTGKQARDLGVRFCAGCGISTSAERSVRRLDAARTSAAMGLPRL